LVVIVGLILAFVLIVIFANRRTRGCRWREDRRADRDGMRKFRCAACGAETFTMTGKPPLDCLADQKR
jgi:hypothetical protein